jgi:hypothetical protein
MNFARFILIFILLVILVLSAVTWAAQSTDAAYTRTAVAGAGLAALLTLGAYGLANRSLRAAPGKFVSGVMGALGLKMAVALVVMIAVAVLAKAHLKPFALSFFAGYVPFTAFEVWALMRNLRAVSKTPSSEPNTP